MKFYTHLWKWTLDEALKLIQPLQTQIRPLGYHLTLGGGVLNKGESEHDLDLYFHPMNNVGVKEDELIKLLDTLWGEHQLMGGFDPARYPDTPQSTYSKQIVYTWSGLRIDVFVVRGGQTETVPTDIPAIAREQAGTFIGFGEGGLIDWIQGQGRRLHLETDRAIAGAITAAGRNQWTIGDVVYNERTRVLGIVFTDVNGLVVRRETIPVLFAGPRLGGLPRAGGQLANPNIRWEDDMRGRVVGPEIVGPPAAPPPQPIVGWQRAPQRQEPDVFFEDRNAIRLNVNAQQNALNQELRRLQEQIRNERMQIEAAQPARRRIEPGPF